MRMITIFQKNKAAQGFVDLMKSEKKKEMQ